MGKHYQWMKVDGTPKWTVGFPEEQKALDASYDFCRFHQGRGFRIVEKGDAGPVRSLREIAHYLPKRLREAPLDRVLAVVAESDGATVKLRSHQVADDKGQLFLAHLYALLGEHYSFGVPPFHDCSWLMDIGIQQTIGLVLPHNSEAIFAHPAVITIPRSKAIPGDFLDVHAPDHIAAYRGPDAAWLGDTVIDTEPSDAPRPQGGNQGTGVRVRSMRDGYYCSWANVSRVGRIVAINGQP